MGDWNEQAAPNNNIPANRLRSQNLKLSKQSKFKGRSSKNTAITSE
ncbi:hypothetical protein [Bacillus sp. J37]|nr:hypothetical protein [Bacillus sp. J37]